MSEPVAAYASEAFVATEAAPRYLKQLVSHLGRRLTVTEEGASMRFELSELGRCLATPSETGLRLQAQAVSAEGLERVQDVVGRHLERFGQRHELDVRWTPTTTD